MSTPPTDRHTPFDRGTFGKGIQIRLDVMSDRAKDNEMNYSLFWR